jgi:hypothetical protein
MGCTTNAMMNPMSGDNRTAIKKKPTPDLPFEDAKTPTRMARISQKIKMIINSPFEF